MSSPRSKWLPCLFCFQFHVVFLTYSLILIGSTGAENQIILLRDKNQDFFSYTDNRICKNASNPVYLWCKSINAYEVQRPPWAVNNTCSCECQYNFVTFLSKEGKCVNISYLKSHEDFGDDGLYIFGNNGDPADLSTSGTLMIDKKYNGCQVNVVQYFTEDKWKNITGTAFNRWNISKKYGKKCNLTWPAMSKETDGRILKILLENCTVLQNKNNQWKRSNPKIFIKSKGYYSICYNVSTSIPLPVVTSGMAPTPTLTRLITSSVRTKPPVRVSTTASFVSSSMRISNFKMCSSSIDSSLSTFIPIYTHHGMVPTPSVVTSSVQTSTGQGPYIPTQNGHKKDEQRDETPSPATGAIAGAVIACGVVGGIVVLLVVLRRRRRDNTRAGKPDSLDKAPPGDSTDNPTYGKTQGEVISLPNRQHKTVQDTDEYDYATVDGDRSDHKTSKPIYQSLVKDNVQESVYTPLNKETPEDYNHLQHPVYKPPHSNSDPLYNVLEGPNGSDDYLEPGVHIDDNQTGLSEPVYNVLEDSNADNDPLYNVLEDPNHAPRDEPLYNVLEDPDDDYDNAPIADDQNPPASGQDNIAYSSTIDLKRSQSFPDYDVLEGPEGSLQDSTYQPLNIRTRNDNAPIEDADQNLPASGQDNIAYSSTIDLNIPQSPSSPDYDVLEGPEGSLPDMTYEPLSTMARDDDVYQPLDRASRYSYQPHNDPHNASTA